jgi:large repetitive protein
VLVVVALAAVGIVAGATAAAAAGAITVTPSTGLVDGQTVSIDGSGWIAVAQLAFCEAVVLGPPDASNCGNGTINFATADGTGNFSGSPIIKRNIFVPKLGRQVDCADPAAQCVLAAADFSNVAGTVVWVNLGFAPAPPVIVPSSAPVLEGNSGATSLSVPVTLSFASALTVTAQWTTLFVSGAPCCQADPATDYTSASGTVTFAPGDTAETVTISVNGDTLVEPDEYIVVSFTSPTNATLGGFWGLGFGAITNDD